MYLNIEIDSDNDAFVSDARAEACRILEGIATKLKAGECFDSTPLRDLNGNSVGTVSFNTPDHTTTDFNDWDFEDCGDLQTLGERVYDEYGVDLLLMPLSGLLLDWRNGLYFSNSDQVQHITIRKDRTSIKVKDPAHLEDEIERLLNATCGEDE